MTDHARSSDRPLHAAAVGPDDAPTCVLLHGVGTTSWMWRAVVDRLRDEVHVVTVDLPGHGASAARPWVSMADTVSAVSEVVDQVAHGGVAHVVGLSLGGYVALDLAAAHPARVPSVLASGVNVLPFPRPRLMRVAGHLMSPLMGTGMMLRANARALGVAPDDYAGYAEAARSMARGTFVAVGGELMDYRVPPAAARSSSRVLAVAGSDEQALILGSLAPIAAAFPDGQARVVPGGGHAWNGQLPDLFAATVLAHLEARPLPDALVPAPST